MKLISGMHRSGTSLVAQIFAAAGADLGDPATFYRPDRWNPDGYFEQTEVHAVNMPLINGPFWKLAYFFLPSEETILRRARSRAGEIARVADRYRGKVVKENRFCLTLPAWLAHGATIEKLLVVLREPAAVARSLRRRNHVGAKRAYSLWLVHNRRLLRIAEERRIPHRFVRYRDLLGPDRQVDEALSMLGFFGVSVTRERVAEILAAAVKPALDHNAGATPPADYPPEVRALWSRLVEACSRQGADGAPVPVSAGLVS
jgi:hypothetical protein